MGIESGMVGLLGTLAMIPIVGFVAVWLVHKMVSGDVSLLAGLLGFATLLGLFAIAVLVPDNRMMLPVLVILVCAMVFFPFAETQLEKIELTVYDTSRIDKAHRELAVRPDNVAARFELARAIYDRGLKGHAIALAENTLSGLSSEPGGQNTPSLRDMFRSEAYQVKNWRRELKDPHAFDDVRCRACQTMNPAGTLECARCKSPYILELARSLDGTRGVTARLLVGFALTVTLLVVCSWISLNMGGAPRVIGIVVAMLGVGGLLAYVFRPTTLRG